MTDLSLKKKEIQNRLNHERLHRILIEFATITKNCVLFISMIYNVALFYFLEIKRLKPSSVNQDIKKSYF
jgi:hypothetical protein